MRSLPRNSLNVLLALAVLACATQAQALDPTEWRNRQSAMIEHPGLVKLALPAATLDAARSQLEDLRLLDPSGTEVPFVVERAQPLVSPSQVAPKSFRVELHDAATELILETGTTAPLATVTLISPAPVFLKAARVEVSDDLEHWTLVRTGVPIVRQFGGELLTVELARQTAAHIRILLDDSRTKPVLFTGAKLGLQAATKPAATAAVPVTILRREEFAGETVLTLDFGAKNLPLARLTIDATDPLFTRAVRLSASTLADEKAVEQSLGTGLVYRIAADGVETAERRDLPLTGQSPARELSLHIDNGDSPPLSIRGVSAEQRLTWITFSAATPGTYTLLTGNPDVAAPRYDVSRLAASIRGITAAPEISVGTLETNPAYRRKDTLAQTVLLGGAIDVSPWRYRKPVTIERAGIQQLELDLDVLTGTANALADLRLVRSGTQLPYLIERPALSRSVLLTTELLRDAKRPQISRWRLQLPKARAPLTRLTLTSDTPLFQRQLRVFDILHDDRNGEYERVLADAAWQHTPTDNRPLHLALNGVPAGAAVWVETDNGDNPSIALTKVTGEYPVIRLLFKSDAEPVSLHYGNAAAAEPHYDISLVATQLVSADRQIAQLGEEAGARPRLSSGWGERAGILFWSALALVVIVLLVVVAKLLPKPPAAP